MRHPSSIEPFTPSVSVTLHPALQAALENLDIQIDEELARYRRQRRSSTPAPRRPLPRQSGSTAIGILQNSIHLPAPRSSIYADQSDADLLEGKQPNSRQTHVGQPVRQAAVTPSQVEQFAVAAPTLPPPMPVAAPAAPATLPSLPDAGMAEAAQIPSYAEQYDLSAYTPTALQKFVRQDDAEPEAGYFASSEELLRSIAEEDPERRAEREPNAMLDTLLTPLGIGSMLLLLLSSTTLGYVMMNPSSLGLWTSRSMPNAKTGANPSPVQKPASPSPDLASNEFIDLNLNTLSTLPKQAAPSIAQSPQPKSPQDSSAQSASTAAKSAESKPSSPQTVSPQTVATASVIPETMPAAPKPQTRLSTVVVPAKPPVAATPKPAPAPPAPVSPQPIRTAPRVATGSLNPAGSSRSSPSESGFSESGSRGSGSSQATSAAAPTQNRYYVVTNYSGDASLRQARTAVPDAYVRNLPSEGAKVQLGSFDNAAQAEALQQQLQQQGIQAEIYQPQ